MNLSIQARIFGGFVALLVIFGGISGYSAWQVRALGERVAFIHRELLPIPLLIAEIASDLRGLDVLVEPRDRAQLRRGVHLARRVHPYLTRIKAAFVRGAARLTASETTPLPGEVAEMADRFEQLDALRATLAAATETFFDQVESDQDFAASRERVRRIVGTLGRELVRFDADVKALLDRAVADFGAEEDRAVWNAIGLVLLAMALGVAITLDAGRTLRPLKTLRAGVERIARGEYADPVQVRGGNELGALAADFNQMAEAIRRRDEQLSAQQKELLDQERLATVGRLSAQITHELRNPLSSIGLNSELLLDDLAEGEARGLLENIIREVERLGEITESYLAFARLPRPEPVALDLERFCRELLDFVRGEMEQANVRVRLDAEKPSTARPVRVDPNPLRSALLNLLRNAREAVEPAGGGHVVLRVRTLGEAATLEVVDDGPGLTEEASRRLFEPFFSTKANGTGLGLSLVRKIVREQGGRVVLESAPGRGTTVRLELPLCT